MRVRVSAVFEREQEILCMKYIYGGKVVFALPGGGVDKDIPLQEAIINEWRNEIGVKLDVGEIILELRDEARRLEGSAFDLRRFHDRVIGSESVGLDRLRAIVREDSMAQGVVADM